MCWSRQANCIWRSCQPPLLLLLLLPHQLMMMAAWVCAADKRSWHWEIVWACDTLCAMCYVLCYLSVHQTVLSVPPSTVVSYTGSSPHFCISRDYYIKFLHVVSYTLRPSLQRYLYSSPCVINIDAVTMSLIQHDAIAKLSICYGNSVVGQSVRLSIRHNAGLCRNG